MFSTAGQMGGGDKLYEKIDKGIRAAKLIICLVTEKYAASPNCNKEVNSTRSSFVYLISQVKVRIPGV